MKKCMHGEFQHEAERDNVTRFIAESYVSKGYYLHFHRNTEIYGVIKGKVLVTVSGESRVLKDGQMAVIAGMENHGYEIEGEAEVFYFHIGTQFLRDFVRLYPDRQLPRWLGDEKYNHILYRSIQQIIEYKGECTELRKYGIVNQVLSDMIERYGTVEKRRYVEERHDLTKDVLQYIYDHYSEEITLESLSKMFYISSKALSKILTKDIKVDLRVFVNDIRVQKVVEMREDPAYRKKTLHEIVAMCGFRSMSTFYRSYKRNFKFKG